jgi:transcriptional regulator with XRE-family HTH domain
MDGEPWQMRVKALGISQVDLADALGYTTPKLSAALRGKGMANGVPKHLRALIIALEDMSADQRADWLVKAKAERRKPKGEA